MLHEQPRAGDAGLTGSGEDSGDDALYRVVEVRVVEHDVRGLSAELHADALQPLRRGLVDERAGAVRAGECDFCDQGMLDERHADFRPESGHDVDHPRREPGLLDELHELQDGRRGEFGGLEHHGVAGREGGRELPCGEEQG